MCDITQFTCKFSTTTVAKLKQGVYKNNTLLNQQYFRQSDPYSKHKINIPLGRYVYLYVSSFSNNNAMVICNVDPEDF